jgi:hypothetical protein
VTADRRITLAAFIVACDFCLHLNYGRRFCSECGAKLPLNLNR